MTNTSDISYLIKPVTDRMIHVLHTSLPAHTGKPSNRIYEPSAVALELFTRVKLDVARVLTAEAKFEVGKPKRKVRLKGGEEYKQMLSEIIDSLYESHAGSVGVRSAVQALELFGKAQKAILGQLEEDARSEAGYRRCRAFDIGM